MTVIVDRQPLAVSDLGLKTLGQVFGHLQKDNRLVVHVLIDGQAPDPERMAAVRQTALAGHTVYIETADPRKLAIEVLDGSADQLPEAERLKQEAAELLQKSQTAKAMEQLAGCLRIWQHAQESIEKTAELLRISLSAVQAADQPLENILERFALQLRQIRTALQQRDFVSLSDVLLYETQTTTADWLASIDAMRQLIRSIR